MSAASTVRRLRFRAASRKGRVPRDGHRLTEQERADFLTAVRQWHDKAGTASVAQAERLREAAARAGRTR